MVLNREEMFIANICGESYDLPAPQTRNELLLKSILDGDETTLSPVTRIELYLASISGKDVGDLPQPRTRIEMYLAAIAGMEIEPPIPLTSLEHWLASWHESGGSGEEFTTEFLPIVSIMDALAKPARAVVAKMEPIQDLHGYDSPWPAGGGKNKLNNTATTTTSNGVTFTVNADGSVSCSGTATGTAVLRIYQTFSYAEDMILSGCPSGGDYNVGYSLFAANSSGSAVSDEVSTSADLGNGVTIASQYISNIAQIQLIVRTGINMNGKVFYPMIRLASVTDATYAPYSNLCPISGRTGVTAWRTGKNLFNISTKTDGQRLNASGVIAGNSSMSISDYIPVSPSTYYTLSSGSTVLPGNARSVWYDANKIFISAMPTYEGTAVSEQSPANAHYARLTLATSDAGVTQFEIGSTASDYSEYSGATYPVTWQDSAGTVYGGTVDVVSGVLTVTHAYVDLGDLTWYYQPAYQIMYANVTNMFAPTTSDGRREGILSTIYTVSSTTIVNNAMDDKSMLRYIGNIYIRDTSYVDTDVFATAMTGQTLVYQLATPQTYQLTPTQIELLKGANVLWSDADAVQVTYLKKKDS